MMSESPSDPYLLQVISVSDDPSAQEHEDQNKNGGGRKQTSSTGALLQKGANFLFSLALGTIKDSDTDFMVPGASYKAISKLILSDYVEGLRDFLDTHHFNIDDRDEEGSSLLHLAAGQGNKDIVSLLINKSAGIFAEDFQKCNPLHVAAREGHRDVCLELIDAGSPINQPDMGSWTPFMWACYYGHTETVSTLMESGCDINVRGIQQVSALNWAAGRGHESVVQLLLEEKNMKVDLGDKYGTTALIWAARKGYVDIVRLLLRHGANVDAVGMYSWTPLLVATSSNFVQIVDLLLEKNPNVNKVDKDGLTALAIACKEGYKEIAFKLISYGAYINLQDKYGDTNLIYAAKGGHKSIVDALLKKHADVNMKGKDNRTCLHYAIDKGHTHIVKSILNVNPDLEIRTIDGDTALLRAVKSRNEDIVQMLLDKKAKLSATDSKQDTPLHIAMRARSKAIVEILLRNPKHSHLLYRPNRSGETPYTIDVNSNKSILGQVFGARKLNTNEDGENMLGYDLYSSSLADILTEPSLSMPMTVGLYAKWGSGKSFLLSKLRDEMKSFTREWVDPSFHNSPLLFAIILHIAACVGIATLIITYSASSLGNTSGILGFLVALLTIVLSYIFIFTIRQGSYRFNWLSLNIAIASKFNSLKLVFQVIFCHPPGQEFINSVIEVQPLRLLFTEQTKVITSAGGQNSVTQMIGSLYDAIELQYGKFASRLFRAFRPTPIKNTAPSRWKRVCCIPYIVIYFVCFFLILAGAVLIMLELKYASEPLESSVSLPKGFPTKVTTTFDDDDDDENDENDDEPIEEGDFVAEKLVFGLLIFMGIMLLLIIVANIYNIGRGFHALIFSQRQHLHRTVSKLDFVKSEGYLQAVKGEVQLLQEMVKGLDAFTGQQSRMVVVVDGLDSCEQGKVLSVLDAMHMLFSDRGSPFIIILAIDPHVITKAIELNLNRAFIDTSIGGNAYLRNLVHLPFFLQNAGLRKVKLAQKVANKLRNMCGPLTAAEEHSSDRRQSVDSSSTQKTTKSKGSSKAPHLRKVESVASSLGSRVLPPPGEPSDLTKILLSDDYFSDVNPRSLKRLMNVIYVMGRLLKAFHIDFNWHRLSSWVNITEQWPYHASWITIFVELNEDHLDDLTPLKNIYNDIKGIIPTQKELEPLLEMDRDEKKFETFLSLHKKNLAVLDVKIFLPFTINLDPYLRKIIKDEINNMEEMGIEVPTFEGPNQGGGPSSGSTGPTLTRRQVAELNRKMSQHDLVSLGATGAVPYPNYPIPYPSSMARFGPSAAGHPSGPTPGNYYDMFPRTLQEKSVSLMQLPTDLTGQNLSQQTTEEVCELVRTFEGLSLNKLDEYCSKILSENVSGQVLKYCNLEELKSVMGMNFGDWEIFKNIVLSLRNQERKNKTVKFSVGDSTDQQHIPSANKHSADPPPMQQKKHHQDKFEKQVTLEDAMISGLLSTLNEDAQEDVLSEEISAKGSLTQLSHSNLSPSIGSINGVESDNALPLITHQKGSQSENEASVIYLSHTSPLSSSKLEAHMDLEKGYGSRSRALSGMPGWSSHGEVSMTASVPTSPQDESVDPNAILTSSRKSSSGSSSSRVRSRTLDDTDPYSWLSSTAPTSPDHSRRAIVDRKGFLGSMSHRFSIGSSSMSQVLQSHMTLDKLNKKQLNKEEASPKSLDSDDSSSSSPEQQTVSKRPSLSNTRGPHIQDIFSTSPQSDEGTEQVLTAILPDGKNLTMPTDPK